MLMTLIMWMYGMDSLEEIYQDFDKFHLCIKLTLECSTQQLYFLDTAVKFHNFDLTPHIVSQNSLPSNHQVSH